MEGSKSNIGGKSLFGDLFGQLRLDSIFKLLDPREDIVASNSPWPGVVINTSGEVAIIKVELAGYDKKNLILAVEGPIITISGELDNTGFNKTFRFLTSQFDADSVRASYKNGLLTITLDRVEAKPKIEKRLITIQ